MFVVSVSVMSADVRLCNGVGKVTPLSVYGSFYYTGILIVCWVTIRRVDTVDVGDISTPLD